MSTHILRWVAGTRVNLGTTQDPLVVTLPSPEPLTSAMFLFLHCMKDIGKGPVSPKLLFNQLCHKAPRFKGYQQQDSQELLHYLLDAMRVEETKNHLSYQKTPDKCSFGNEESGNDEEDTPANLKCHYREAGSKKVAANGNEKDGSNLDSSNDADSEASESECPSKQTVNSSTVDYIKTDSSNHSPSKYKDCNHNEPLTCAVSKLSLNSNMNETLISNPNQDEQTDSMSHSKDSAKEKPLISQNPQVAFQSLSHSYVPSSKECSVQSCLYQFTSVELLMGNNKLLCENCTEKRQKHQKRTITTAEKKPENVYTNARKQMLISVLPPIVTLHLKRFHQAGMSLRKVNRHVDFPMVLDLAPFCSASCKNVVESERVLYSLYGIVEHSGSMRGGHYTAYVKIRSRHKRQEHRRNVAGQVDWAALAQAWIAQKESSGPNVVDQQGMQPNGQENQGLDTGPNNNGNFQGDPNFSSMWQPDAVKRRTLPAWIREGLEKMEREKQKKLEKERMDKQRAEMAKDEEKDKEELEEEGDGPCLPRKSKFVSISA
ncbi:UNVERIFIED_CONTAM: hypothetical protein FKN15_067478 [Acipenser sinensis]